MLYLVLQGKPDAPKCLRLVGSELRYLNPDERSTASLIRNALIKFEEGKEVMSSPGIYISRRSFLDILEELAKPGSLFYLKENGKPFSEDKSIENPVFVLGDDKDLFPEEEEMVISKEPHKITLGPKSLHADHCITIMHNILDNIY